MTQRRSAQLAGFAFLFYIAIGITSLVLFPSTGSDTATRLTTIAARAATIPLEIVLTLMMSISAVTLGVTLHALTRHVDREIAILGMTFRAMEGMTAALAPLFTLGLLHLATRSAEAPDTNTLATLLFRADQWKTTIASLLFSVGSLFFTILLLRGRVIPRLLAWIGAIASVILVICLPLQLSALLPGTVATWMWLPMLSFEVPAGVWLILRGGNAPVARSET